MAVTATFGTTTSAAVALKVSFKHERMPRVALQGGGQAVLAMPERRLSHQQAAPLGAGTRRSSRGSSSTRQRLATRPQAAVKQTFRSFEDMIQQSDVPVLVDFYAVWCGPCQMMSSMLGDISTMFGGDKLRVVKIDTDKYPGLATQYNVQGLPTLILFKDGQPVDRVEGLMQQQQLADRLRYFLARP